MDQVPLHLIVVAAGSSRRYGGGDKLLADLNGAPVFVHALRRLTPAVTGKCVLVVPQGKSRIFQEAAFPFVRDLKLIWCEGGESRSASVKKGVAALQGSPGIAAVHDAARPLASAALLRRVAAQAEISGGAIAAVKVVDSLKRVDASNCVLEPVSRDDLYRAETPQVFDIGKIRQAYRQADRSGVTDDAEIMRRAGFTVEVVDSGEFNLKLTRLFDLEMLKIFFAAGN